ncbi:MAG: polysaccharide deacetylase family protein [Candidatus Marinimicrobia bacterium]|nr:polysaccharide deacetylase family protein [Candidatus Neomarinimicrobiota bacterium]
MKKIILFVVATILCFLGFVASAHSAQKAVVSFTFDDGYVSVYRNAFVKLRVFDFPATVYVATSLIHKEAGVKMSWEQMKLLSQYGWEVGCHTHSHKNITRLSQEELSFEINTSISLLNEHGFKVQAFAPPHGDLDETSMPLIKNKFTSSRRAWKAKSLDDDLNSFVGLDRFNIESFELKHTTKIEEVKRLITRVVKEKKWLVFFAHAIVSTEPSEYQFATEKFNEIVNFVAEFVEKKQAEVLTISQALGYEDKHKKYEAIEAPVAGKVALVEKKTVSKISVKPMVVAEEAPAELAKEEKDKFPLALPFSSWGEVRWGNGKINEGLVLDSYFEQGADLYRWGNFTFNSFIGLRVSQSSENRDYWNNKFGPWFGVKIKHPFKLFPRAWGELSLGVRGEYYNYTSSAIDDNEFRAVLFFQWSFGGDWYDYNKGGW